MSDHTSLFHAMVYVGGLLHCLFNGVNILWSIFWPFKLGAYLVTIIFTIK